MQEEPFLLRLPRSIRYRVYAEPGIIRDAAIDMSSCSPQGEWSEGEKRVYTDEEFSYRPRFSNQLFYVSKAPSEDVLTAFFSQNRLEFAWLLGEGFHSVKALGLLAWKSFRAIGIVLDDSYHPGGTEYHLDEYDRVFSADECKSSRVLPDWQYVCEQLAAHQSDAQLELRLICDAWDRETAAAVLRPLYMLPRLKDLRLHVGPFWNPHLQGLITSTIQNKTGKSEQAPAPFRFLDLPVELQLRVLEYAGLVSSLPLAYSKCRRMFLPRNQWTLSGSRREYCQGHSVLPCRTAPHMLFLVSSAMRDLATSIFYARNSFHVDFKMKTSPAAADWAASKSAFLSCFPKHSFHYLRHIRWQLHSPPYNSFQPGEKETEDWAVSLFFLSIAVPPGLTIELDMASYLKSDRVNPYKALHCAARWALYERVTSYLDCLRDRLTVYIGAPGHSSLANVRLQKEQALERSIMGAGYDSSARGRRHPWGCAGG